MKKTLIRIIALMSILFLMPFKVKTVTAYAANEYGIQVHVEDRCTVRKYQRSNSKENVAHVVNSSNNEECEVRSLLKELNFAQRVIDNMSDEELRQISQCSEIYTTTTYALEKDGTITYSGLPVPLKDVSNADSYQRIIMAIWDDPDSNEEEAFLLTASMEWLKMPTYRMTDAFGITSKETNVLYDERTGLLNAVGAYEYTHSNGILVRHDFSSSEFVKMDNGVYSGIGVKFDLPASTNLEKSPSDFWVYLRFPIHMVHPTLETNFEIVASYIHSYIQLLFEPSIQFDDSVAGAIGLSFTQASNLFYAGMNYTYYP